MSVPPTSDPDGELLNECVRRTAAGDRTAFQTLYELLSPYVRDSAACLFGSGESANTITDSVFVDVWHLAGQYEPGGEGVRTWVLSVAGRHTMTRFRPD